MTSGPAELAKLIVATAGGDRTAFRGLYLATAPKLLGIAMRITRSRAEAEEVVQDAFIRVWHNAGSFQPGAGTPLAWMASITRNRAIDVIRIKVPVTLSSEDDDTAWTERIADPRDHADEVATRDALNRCLATIEPQTRDMIVRAYCNGDSREELASRYDRPVNTIKTLLHRALSALKTCMGETT